MFAVHCDCFRVNVWSLKDTMIKFWSYLSKFIDCHLQQSAIYDLARCTCHSFLPLGWRSDYSRMLFEHLPVDWTREGCLFGRHRCYIDMLARKPSCGPSKALLVVVLVVVVECIRSMPVLVVVVVAVERERCSKLHWRPRCIAEKKKKNERNRKIFRISC